MVSCPSYCLCLPVPLRLCNNQDQRDVTPARCCIEYGTLVFVWYRGSLIGIRCIKQPRKAISTNKRSFCGSDYFHLQTIASLCNTSIERSNVQLERSITACMFVALCGCHDSPPTSLCPPRSQRRPFCPAATLMLQPRASLTQ